MTRARAVTAVRSLPELLDGWRDTVRELDEMPFPDDRAGRTAIRIEIEVLRTVIGQVEAVPAVPRDMAAATEITRDLGRQRDEAVAESAGLRGLSAELIGVLEALQTVHPGAIAKWRKRAGLGA